MSKNIVEKDKNLRIELELSQATESELVKKLGTYQKVIRQLNEKIAKDEQDQIERENRFLDQLNCKEREIVTMKSNIINMENIRDKEKHDLVMKFPFTNIDFDQVLSFSGLFFRMICGYFFPLICMKSEI